jgi:hypothetical protein
MKNFVTRRRLDEKLRNTYVHTAVRQLDIVLVLAASGSYDEGNYNFWIRLIMFLDDQNCFFWAVYSIDGLMKKRFFKK